LKRIGAVIEQSAERRRVGMMQRGLRIALEKVRRRGLYHPPPVSILVLSFFNRLFINILFSVK